MRAIVKLTVTPFKLGCRPSRVKPTFIKLDETWLHCTAAAAVTSNRHRTNTCKKADQHLEF
jgi:hypothetical protein